MVGSEAAAMGAGSGRVGTGRQRSMGLMAPPRRRFLLRRLLLLIGIRSGCSRCGGSFVLLGEERVGAQAEGGAQLLGVEVGERARAREDQVGDVALAGHDLFD